MGFCKSLTAILAASLVLSLFYQAQAVVVRLLLLTYQQDFDAICLWNYLLGRSTTLTCASALVQNTTAAAEVVRLAAADPTVLATANNVITAVRNSALTNGLTSFDVATVTADPKVQAAVVPFIEAAAAAAGPAWLDVVPQTAAVAQARDCPAKPPLMNLRGEPVLSFRGCPWLPVVDNCAASESKNSELRSSKGHHCLLKFIETLPN